jgi:branched-chain amino acid transport system ATP-binding protein
MSLLEVREVSRAFGGVMAVDRVSFEVAAGEVVALLGPNGAGKSTCFNLLNGQLHPDSGSIRFDGRDVTRLQPHQLFHLGVARTFQIAATFSSFTVLENVQMVLLARERQISRLWRRAGHFHRDEAMALLARVGMASFAHHSCGELAYGDVKRVELAIALANRPRLLLMDEPTAGMAPAERIALMEQTRALVASEGLAVLFTEHNMDAVFSFADRMLVLARGQVIASGDGAAIRADRRVQEVYLGSATTFRVRPAVGVMATPP